MAFLAVLLACTCVHAAEPDALAISANIQAKHFPFGTVLDPVYASATSNQIVNYTHCGDSAIWTGHYLAAEAFRYQVTGSADALANARAAVLGLRALVDITGTDVLARCFVPGNSPYLASIEAEESHNGLFTNRTSGAVWVGNTSRDAYSGAMFGLGVAYDLVNDASLRAQISDVVTRMIDALAAHAWTIVMPDFSVSTTFVGRNDQILAFLAIARHVNPEHYAASYNNVLKGAAEMIAPITIETFSDDSYFKFNLDYINLYGLLRLQNVDAANTAYNILRTHTASHQNAHFNMFDRALRGANASRDAATLTYLDAWLARSRRDAFVDLSKQVAVCGSAACNPVPIVMRPPTDFLWQRTPYLLTGGGTGTVETAGIDYILPYWMSRYFGVGAAFTVQSAAAGTLVVAPDSIASIYGLNLATQTAQASSLPLPTTLGGATLAVRDANGTTRNAALLYVSPTQINFIVPSGTAPGVATFTVGSLSATGVVASIAPAIFAANSAGSGPAADNVGNGYITLYGTGLRNHATPVVVTIAGIVSQVMFAGAQGQYAGLDQINVAIPETFRALGESNVQVIVDGVAANVVTVTP